MRLRHKFGLSRVGVGCTLARHSALHQYSKINLHEIELNEQVILGMGHFNFCLVARVENRASAIGRLANYQLADTT
jgi:hypothetical protein